MNFQAIILAAGQGTRMRSKLPKVLHKVCGQTLIHRSILAVKSAGVGLVTVVVGTGRNLVEAEIARHGFSGVDSAHQVSQLGTGDAAKAALPQVKSKNLIILPGDVPLLSATDISQAIELYNSQGPDLLFISFKPEEVHGFGRVVRNESGEVQSICEEKDCSAEQKKIREVNAGIYICSKTFLVDALESLNTDNAQGEFYLTDIVSYAKATGKKIEAFCAPSPLSLAGANSRKDLSVLEAIRRRQIVEELMDKGVGFEDSNQVYIDEGVVIEPECFIGAGTRLQGETTLAEGVQVEGETLIRNTKIGSGTHVKLGSVFEESEIGKDCSVGPFAHLRPGSKLGNNVKVGNFVETKKTILHDGVKAGHVSYLGDAEIHPEANIGAGTIICNYDGKNKHQTVIGKGAFIGSNSCLVAPVKIGDDAYIGAGSTITKKVPDRALGLGRARQTNKDDWSK